ncbi:hypothetical protein MTR_3g075370 [Medicago truncatula]|uniref:Uncharacterized protein n=1 Tax=Medicago truncatula TaxID=3880 RepID=G8A2F9_MEDTR|nr:hypothetical protein MTR_3g075370 [Medicago truncatula]
MSLKCYSSLTTGTGYHFVQRIMKHRLKYFGVTHKRSLRLCLGVWRGRGGEGFGKRKEQVEEIEDIGRRGLWRLIFYS